MGTMIADIQDFSFLTGTWTAEIWGGIFEETWLAPKGETVVGLGRHTANGKTTFVEFASIERSKDGDWTLFMILGSPKSGQKTPKPFKLSKSVPGKMVEFVDPLNDFPTNIKYEAMGKDKFRCTIYGRADGKKEEEVFNFIRAK